MSNENTNTSASTGTKYINLLTEGKAMLSRGRIVTHKGGSDLWVTLGAMEGSYQTDESGKVVESDINFTDLDCQVVGEEAKEWISALMADINSDRKVKIAFKAGGLNVETYEITKGPREGQTGVSLKSRLLKVYAAYVDGKPFELKNEKEKPQQKVA